MREDCSGNIFLRRMVGPIFSAYKDRYIKYGAMAGTAVPLVCCDTQEVMLQLLLCTYIYICTYLYT